MRVIGLLLGIDFAVCAFPFSVWLGSVVMGYSHNDISQESNGPISR